MEMRFAASADVAADPGYRGRERMAMGGTRENSKEGFCGGLYRIYYDAHSPGLVCARRLRLMYSELHARSAFSFLEGASTPEELAGLCAERGLASMALLDRDGVYGAPRFHLAAAKLSIPAHIGAEVTSEDGWRYPLLVESRAGYQNLCRLITRMKLRARKRRRPRFP